MDKLFNSIGMVNAGSNSQLNATLEVAKKSGHSIGVKLYGTQSSVSGYIEELHLDEGWIMVKEKFGSGDSYCYSVVNLAFVLYVTVYA